MSTYTEVKLRTTRSYSLHILCNECYVACQKIGARGGAGVEAMRYKPEGRRFNSRWCHWNYSLT